MQDLRYATTIKVLPRQGARSESLAGFILCVKHYGPIAKQAVRPTIGQEFGQKEAFQVG